MKKLLLLPMLATSLILIGFSSSSFYGMMRHDVDIERYRALGRKTDFDCVGRYSVSEADRAFAAGVLIAPQWVLTAAHFVEEPSVWKFGDRFYRTKRILKHPKLQPDGQEAQFDGRDMALIQLEYPVADIKPAERYRGNDELGKTITKIGYGYAGNGKGGMENPRVQERLGGENIVDAIGGTFEDRQFSTNVMVCDFDDPENPETNHFGSAIPLELEIGGSKGDSGGGVFMEDDGGFVLVGIVSGALNREIKYGAVMSLARVSRADSWIDSVID